MREHRDGDGVGLVGGADVYKPTLAVSIDGVAQKARLYPILALVGAQLELRHLLILADGRIDFNGRLLTVEQLSQLVDEGVLRTGLAEREHLYIPELLAFRVSKVIEIVEETEFLKEVADIILELNGERTTSDICRERYEAFLKDRSEENRLRLKDAYEQVPRHLDIWLLPFPRKPTEIEQSIYGNSQRLSAD